MIAGTNLGTAGTVKFGATTATTTAWSATSVTAKVPASLAPGGINVTVTPTGGSASNALSFTVDAPAPRARGDITTAPTSEQRERVSGPSTQVQPRRCGIGDV